MSEITKEELLAFTEASNKTATALEAITNRLTDIIAKQDKLIEKVSNGINDDIKDCQAHLEEVKKIVEKNQNNSLTIDEIKTVVVDIRKDSGVIRWALAIFTGVAVVLETFLHILKK